MARRRTATVEKENEEEQAEPDTEDTDAPDEANGDDDSGDNGLEGRIREIVREVVGPLLETGNGRTGRAADDEDITTHKVKAALDKLKSEEERENRFKKVEETLQKVTERPPARPGIVGKLQRVMWGEDE